MGYGIPLIFTFLAVFISHIISNDGASYLQTNYCWLQEESFIWFYIGPAVAVITFNFFVFGKAYMATNKSRMTRTVTIQSSVIGQSM